MWCPSFCSGIYMETHQAGLILELRPANETALLCNVPLAGRNPDQGRNKMAHVLQSFQMIFFYVNIILLLFSIHSSVFLKGPINKKTPFAFVPAIILWMRPSIERRRYIVTLCLIGWAHTQNDPWEIVWSLTRGLVTPQIWINIGSGKDLLPDGTKPLPEPIWTSH